MNGEVMSSDTVDLRSTLRLVRNRKWWILTSTVLVGGVAYVTSSLQTPLYASSAQLLLSPPSASQDFTLASRAADVQTEIVIMTSSTVHDGIREKLGWLPDVTITPGATTGVAYVSAESDDPAEAARNANAYADAYVEVRREMDIADLALLTDDLQTEVQLLDARVATITREIAELPSDDQRARSLEAERQQLLGQRLAYSAEVERARFSSGQAVRRGAQVISTAASVPTPIRPTPRRDGAAGALAGLVLGFGAVILVSRLDDRLDSPDDVERISGVPGLGLIPPVNELPGIFGRQLLAMSDAHSAGAESYRSLRTALQFLRLDKKLQVVLVTSANPGEGKTSTVANLGAALADAGEKVLVMGCDLRHPQLGRYFGSESADGYTAVLVGDAPLEASLHAVREHPGLAMLGAGPTAPNPSELLGSPGSAGMFERLRSYFDVIIIDSPPVLPVSDALVLSRHADATIVVAQAHKTTQRSLRRALDLLRQVGSPVVGTVLTRADTDAIYGYESNSGYGQIEPQRRPSRRRRHRMKHTSAR